MIRAFAIGIGIGTVRIWLALFQIAGLDFAWSFGPAFWISFSLHVLAAELWLRAFPNPPELGRESRHRCRSSYLRRPEDHARVRRTLCASVVERPGHCAARPRRD